MDPKTFGDWLSGEIGVMAHVSFWVAVGVAAVLIWRAMEWRYAGIIERLRDECDTLTKRAKSRAPAKAATPTMSALPTVTGPEPEFIEPADRVFVGKGVTTGTLMDLYKGHTHAQAGKLVGPFIGKWIKFTTTVRNVYSTDSGGSYHVCGSESDLSSKTIWMTFAKSQFERVETLTREAEITVVGRIEKVTQFDIDLVMCEFAD